MFFWLSIILMGILQGLTEFLPVSSSGHLTLFQFLSSEINDNLSLNIAVHIGTLFTILIYYRKDILQLLGGLAKKDPESREMFFQIVVASIPTAIIGLIMKKKLEWVLTNPYIACVGLIITGIVLLLSNVRINNKSNYKSKAFGISYSTAFLVGIVQGFAVLPGISRSGSTIVAGLFLGMDRVNAARFSFLISVPAIMGAGLLEFLGADETLSFSEMGVGLLVSFLTGLFAIGWMVRLVQQNRLKGFAYYVFCLAAVSFVYIYSQS